MNPDNGGTGCLVGILMASVFGVIALFITVVLLKERARRRQFFDSAARALKGTYKPSGLLSSDRIEFSIAGRPALMSFRASGEDSSGRTTLQVRLRGTSPGTLHIMREGFAQEFLKLFGAQDIAIGDAEFDKVWVVKATPESLALRVFSPERRARAVGAVQRLAGWGDPTIEVTRDRLRIRVRDEIRSESGAITLATTARELLEFLEAPSGTPDIELGEVKIAADSTCPVCGTRLKDLTVRCESCKTPHHSECWTYVGQCSTYACKGKRCVA